MPFPQKKPGATIAVAIKPGGPPPLKSPGEKYDAPQSAPDDEQMEGETPHGSIGPEDVDYSANDLCESCKNMGDDGNCTKYGFPVESTGHCEAGFTPKDEGHMGMGDQQSSYADDSADYGQQQ